MTITHDDDTHDIIVRMTPLEAELHLKRQPTVARYMHAGIHVALCGCEKRVLRKDQAE